MSPPPSHELITAARHYVDRSAVYHQAFSGNCIEQPTEKCLEDGLGLERFDCSGFIIRAMHDALGTDLSEHPTALRHVRDIWRSTQVPQETTFSVTELAVGSLAIIRRRYTINGHSTAIAGHIGIITDDKNDLRLLHAQARTGKIEEIVPRNRQAIIGYAAVTALNIYYERYAVKVTAIKTRLVRANAYSLEALITESLPALEEKSVVAISSKVVALCQNRVVAKADITKNELIRQQADFYTPEAFNRYGFHFTITNNTFISSAGIDESNADSAFVLWPKQPQRVANEIWTFLKQHFNVKKLGVIITDSTSMPPLRRGTIGLLLAHSGFQAVNNLVGKKDLFDRPFAVEKAAIGSGLAAAANVVMGEGAEQTPIAVISELPFVTFQSRQPSQEELAAVYIRPEDDLYAPFMHTAPWQKGSGGAR